MLDQDLYAAIKAGWDTNIVAEPKYHKSRNESIIQEPHTLNIITHKNHNPKEHADITRKLIKEFRRFTLRLYETEDADIETVMEHIEDILTDASVVNGWYELDEDYDDGLEGRLIWRELMGQRIQFVQKGS